MPLVDIPWPSSSNPGKAPGEGSGRLLNAYAYKDCDGTRWRAVPGLAVFATLPAGDIRGGLFQGSTLLLVIGSRVAQIDGAGTVTQLEGVLTGDGPVTMARNNNAISPAVGTITMLARLRLALALATTFCASAPALAADCVQGVDASNRRQCYQPVVPVDPATGLAPGASAATPSRSAETGSSTPADGIAPGVSGSVSSSLVIKASGGNLYSAYATCTAACWLMIFNATSAPADGATTAGTASGNLQDCVPIPAGGTNGINYQAGPGEVFSTGITAVVSSTACATKTAAATGFIHGSAR